MNIKGNIQRKIGTTGDYYDSWVDPETQIIYVAAEESGIHTFHFDLTTEILTYVDTYLNPPYLVTRIVGDGTGYLYCTRNGAGIEALKDTNRDGNLTNVVSEFSVSNPANLDIKDNVLVVSSWSPPANLKFYLINPNTGFPTPVPGNKGPFEAYTVKFIGPHLFIGNYLKYAMLSYDDYFNTTTILEEDYYDSKMDAAFTDDFIFVSAYDESFSLSREQIETAEPFDPLSLISNYNLRSNLFKAPSQEIETKSVGTELPNGQAWLAKYINTTVIYALVYASAGIFRRIKQLIEYLSNEFNLYRSSDLLESVWAKSVGLPDSRLADSFQGPLVNQIKQRLKKKDATVTGFEIQRLVDETFPTYGIWITYGATGEGFRYDFRYSFGHTTGIRRRFTLNIHIPWIAIDPADPENSPLTWDNLKSWFRDFVPSYVLLNPIYEPQASYCVITQPQDQQTVYADPVDGGGYEDVDVYWKQIDVDGSVINQQDTEPITATTSQITRSFTDSTATLIEDTVDINLVVFS